MSEISIERVRALLAAPNDTPPPPLFAGRDIVYERTVTSTMDLARTLAEAGADEGTAVLADEQTAGRGRLGRGWVSPPGENVYLTAILCPPNTHILRELSMLCPLAVCDAAEKLGVPSARIKWPNDVLVSGRKLAGILIQAGLHGERIDYALAGIGLNVNMRPEEHSDTRDIATSLRDELGGEIEREAALAALLCALDARYRDALAGVSPYAGWRRRLAGLGDRARVRLLDRVEEGVAVDVDRDGALILRRDDGSTVRIDAGDLITGG